MKITVNGTEHEWSADEPLCYEAIFAMEHPGKPIRFGASVTYHWRGEGDTERNGTIRPGITVQPADGMHVSIYFTGNA